MKRARLKELFKPQRLLQSIVEVAVKDAEASSGSLMLLNPNTGSLDIEASVGLSEAARTIKLKVGEGITGWVASTGRVFRSNDVTQERRYIAINGKVRSELTIPLNLQRQVIGVLNLDSHKKNAFSASLEKRLAKWTKEATNWILMSWEIEQMRVKGQQLEALLDMGQTIISESELEALLDRIARDSRKLMKAKLCSIMLMNDADELELKAWNGASRAYIRRPNLKVNESLVGVVVNRSRPLTVLNVQEHQHFQHTELAKREGLVSLLAVPLEFQDKVMGVLSVYTEELHRFANEEIRLLSTLAGMSSVALAKARLLERVVRVEEDIRSTERLSALGWLAAEVAHEIRNPLTVMQMLFHSLMQEVELKGGAKKDAELISSKMQHMNRIVDRILTFAQSSEPDLEEIQAEDLIDDIILLVRHKLADQEIEIRRMVDEADMRIRGDRGQLEQALLNLVLNGCQAMSEGGTLTLSANRRRSKDGEEVLISIKDTGEGMSAERKRELFKPFLSTKKGGTGLGLALVQKIVEGHGGRIQVRSTLRRGTTFVLTFPSLANSD